MLRGLLIRRKDSTIPSWDDDLWWFEDPYLPNGEHKKDNASIFTKSYLAYDDDEDEEDPSSQQIPADY